MARTFCWRKLEPLYADKVDACRVQPQMPGRFAKMEGTVPIRIQRKRTKGWRMPPNTVSVTRPGKYGNPYYPGSGMTRGFFDENMQRCEYDVRDPRVQVQWFREHVNDMLPERREEFLAPLRGKNLACWCALGRPCHGDVLLDLANQKNA